MTKFCLIGLSILVFAFTPMRFAKAATAGDAILTVGISTAAGAVLGLSTLPFYGESSAHSRNIFYGAALGAVTGVLVMAYAGFQDSADAAYDEANLRKNDQYFLAKTTVASQSLKPASFAADVLVYSSLYEVRF